MTKKIKHKVILVFAGFLCLFVFQPQTLASFHPQEVEFQQCIDEEILNLETKENKEKLRLAESTCLQKIMSQNRDLSFCENDITLKNEADSIYKLSNSCYQWYMSDTTVDQLKYFNYVKRMGLRVEGCEQAYKKNNLSGDGCLYDLLKRTSYDLIDFCTIFQDPIIKTQCKSLNSWSEEFNSYQDCKVLILDGFRDICFNRYSYESSKLIFWILSVIAIISLFFRWIFRKESWKFIFSALFITLAVVLFDLNTLWKSAYTSNEDLLTAHFNILSVIKNIQQGCEYIGITFNGLLFHSISFFLSLFALMAIFRKSKIWKIALIICLYFLILFGLLIFIGAARMGCG